MKSLFTFFVLTLSISVCAQGPIITPLNGNPALKKAQNQNSKRQLTDTITLPFIDDFTSTTVFPNPKYWVDNQVFINSNFPVSAPSFGVATFDNLNSKGAPYQALSGFTHNSCDSLTSNFINLKYFKSGLSNVNYKISDSIYLSFMYQTQGIGDPLDNSDSLVLKFKDSSGIWKTVWKTTGSALKPFKQVLIPILDPKYLSANFQLRFINFGKSTGNMNQWHLDYIRMKAGRNSRDTLIRDVAINAVPQGPLSYYNSMPYDHFMASPNYHTNATHKLILRNNNPDTFVNVQFSYQVRNRYNMLILDVPPSTSNRNIQKSSDSFENFTKFRLDTLSGKNPFVNIRYEIFPQVNDFTQNDYSTITNNNIYTKRVSFGNQLAFDDGSAEGGYGLDYGSLPAGPGYAAIKFLASKNDTIRGISVFFNRSVADVSFKSFDIMVWQSISEPPANNDDNDVVLRSVNLASALYTDSINQFVDIVFDTAVPINSGNFYIGWKQNIPFMLNVGYDNNYQYNFTSGRNPNLFYNLNGYWESVSSTITGAPMMRPILGAPIPKPSTSIRQSYKPLPKFEIYPNPSESNKIAYLSYDNQIVKLDVLDINGRILKHLQNDSITEVSLDGLNSGIYFIQILDNFGNILTKKLIIN